MYEHNNMRISLTPEYIFNMQLCTIKELVLFDPFPHTLEKTKSAQSIRIRLQIEPRNDQRFQIKLESLTFSKSELEKNTEA